jgi:hypothetical protein
VRKEPVIAAPVEAGGANVDWVGKGEVSFKVTVPPGTASLSWGFGNTSFPNNAAYSWRIHMDGCMDAQGGSSGDHILHDWCNPPRNGTATVTMSTGLLKARVCVMAMPAKTNVERYCGE